MAGADQSHANGNLGAEIVRGIIVLDLDNTHPEENLSVGCCSRLQRAISLRALNYSALARAQKLRRCR